jgi:uncharacterized phosphosugar-binding protein
MRSDPGERMRSHLLEIETSNAEVLDLVVERVYQTVTSDGLLLTTGTGHSLAMVLETFYRAGGLACVRPIVHPALLPFEGGLASTRLERVPGLGRVLVEAASPTASDTAFVFSNSGTNPVPVEMAVTLREAGAVVVAVSSVAHMSQAPARADHKLSEVVDHILDTGAPYGDAFVETQSAPTAALSSLAGVFLWNLMLARLALRADTDGVSLPIWASANVAQGDEMNKSLFARYRGRVPML